ncbi:MAG: arginine--tRNA ligase [Anaerolineae bacterium]|nr:arginine--tRNA ligase [Anaerolineae bacterium]
MQPVRERVADAVRRGFEQAQAAGALPAFEIPEIPVERPRQGGHGDYASPAAMQAARLARMAPVRIAEAVRAHLPREPFIGAVEVAPPGFLNFTLSDAWLASQVETVLAEGERFGRTNMGQGVRVQVEYGSANPTGPLHVGFARNVVLGDALANLLAEVGYDVQREYYVNDAGTQMRQFQESLYARYAQALGLDVPVPETGYQGWYLAQWGREIAEAEGRRFLDLPYEEALAEIGEYGLQNKVLPSVRADVEAMGIRYDRWFSERDLYRDGTFDRAMEVLRQGGYLVEREGAVWFEATKLGADKDEVVIRSSGLPGYFASDIAYHYDKFVNRGFDLVVDVWGADHQGHLPRMKAMMEGLGLDPDRLRIVIYQLVTLKRGGEVVRLSKRTGDMITLRELIDEVSPDAIRYFLVSRSPDSQMDFDLELAVKRSEENPVFYVQYAHARIASVLRLAQASSLDYDQADLSLLGHPSEMALIRQMLQFPEVLVDAAADFSPHRLAYYAYDLARAFHAFYRDCRIVSSLAEDAEVTKARLRLSLAAKVALARALEVMGMSAPERM